MAKSDIIDDYGVLMPDKVRSDDSIFDHPDIISVLFHPRREAVREDFSATVAPVLITVAEDEAIGAVFHTAGSRQPTILFFHGNGEIASDYDDIGAVFVRQGINFFVADYRGYGFSSGQPTVSAMIKDGHAVFDYVKQWLADAGYSGKLFVMGRSLGSACALELAAERTSEISGLIIESGFAYALPLLRLMGVDTDRLGLTEEKGFRNIDKAARSHLPLLVIHAEYDHIIPFSDGRVIFESSPAENKRFITIRKADHNTVFYYGLDDYVSGVKAFVENL